VTTDTRRWLLWVAAIGAVLLLVWFIVTHDSLITAIATGVIAWFTVTMARNSSNQLAHGRDVERAYLTGGGDVVENNAGVEVFRLDVENHGKTPAFMFAYDVQFAKLVNLQGESSAREVRPQHRHIDGLSPGGARKKIRTSVGRADDDDAVFGAVWYEDIWGDTHLSRFILRIAPEPDIKGEGLTRVDVDGVHEDYWGWDYRKNKHRASRA
jgi:hypothetical protein